LDVLCIVLRSSAIIDDTRPATFLLGPGWWTDGLSLSLSSDETSVPDK
jgi:hypothetical protein